jgi:flagellar hook assembly protein FlgD
MNPASNVVFTLASPGLVRIDVFAVDGRCVRTLLNAPYPAGVFQVRWDGADHQGMIAASGNYILRLQSGGFADVRKIVLLK